MKKVLVISNLFPSPRNPYHGTFVKNFYDQIRQDQRVDIVVGCFLKGIPKTILHKLLAYFIFYIKILFYTLFYKFDMIYVHRITHPVPPIVITSFFRKLNLVFNIHGSDLIVSGRISKILLKISTKIVRKSSYIIVPSEFFKEETLIRFPDYPQNKIIISPSGGINLHFFHNVKSTHRKGVIRFGYVSRIIQNKGWEILILSFHNIAEIYKSTELYIVGAGDDEMKLKSIIHKSPYKNQIHYLGPLSHTELPNFYSSIDCFVFPTLYKESLGLVGLEAMASGVPVIGSRSGGLTSYIVENVNGFLFEPGNIKELTSAIIRYIKLSDKDKRVLSLNALTTAKKYESNKVANFLFNKILS